MRKSVRNAILAAVAVGAFTLGATAYMRAQTQVADQARPAVSTEIQELTIRAKNLPVQQIDGLI